jgi:hypothetical protein
MFALSPLQPVPELSLANAIELMVLTEDVRGATFIVG